MLPNWQQVLLAWGTALFGPAIIAVIIIYSHIKTNRKNK